jgi:hypothetical protein
MAKIVKQNLIKIPETQKQDNSIDCGLFSLANAVELCQSGFKGGTHIKVDPVVKTRCDLPIYHLILQGLVLFPESH